MIALSGAPDGLGLGCPCAGSSSLGGVLDSVTCVHFRASLERCRGGVRSEQCKAIDALGKSVLDAKAHECGMSDLLQETGLGKSGMPVWAWALIGVGVLGGGAWLLMKPRMRPNRRRPRHRAWREYQARKHARGRALRERRDSATGRFGEEELVMDPERLLTNFAPTLEQLSDGNPLDAKAHECGMSDLLQETGLGKSGMPVWAWALIGVGVLGGGAWLPDEATDAAESPAPSSPRVARVPSA